MRKVTMYGSIGNSSGYGHAVKNFAEAFSKSGIPTNFKFAKSRMKYVSHLNNYLGKTNTDFYLHCPPYNRHKSSNYKIGYFYWEADRLPNSWARSIKTLDELWVPCNLVKRACIKANFNKKIKVVPTPVRPFDTSKSISIPSYFSEDYILSDNIFKFYSIFQWHERKGYKELLKSYLSEFTIDDNVILILKVNSLNIKNYKDERIKNDILKIKNYLNKSNFPPIYLSKDILPIKDIYSIHSIADCYVAPHHGEGWGMPIHDAMYAKNNIITTKFGGVTEYLNDNSAHIIKHEVRPVTGMDWSSLYGPYQKWAYPDIKHLRYLMRDVFQNHKNYKEKRDEAHRIANSMSIDAVSKIINKNLK